MIHPLNNFRNRSGRARGGDDLLGLEVGGGLARSLALGRQHPSAGQSITDIEQEGGRGGGGGGGSEAVDATEAAIILTWDAEFPFVFLTPDTSPHSTP